MARILMSPDQPVLNRSLLWTGAMLIGAGALIGLSGGALWAAAVVMGLQRHVRESGMPPSELAMHHWRRAKSAARAGADSWQGQVPVPGQRQNAGAPVRMG